MGKKCFWGLALLLLLSLTLHADVTGTILGTIHDQTGAVVPQVTVVATNVDTNLSRETISNSEGEYRILTLPIGNYKIQATAAGFQTFVVTGIELAVNQERRVDVNLALGSTQQQIEISATALQVETTVTQLGQVIESKKAVELPLNGRSYVDLLSIQAGVIPTTASSMQQNRPVSGDLSAGNLSVNGQRETANAYLVNGGDVTEGRNLGTAIVPNLDSIAEFRVITNSFDAEYGKFSGAVMNVITKSGSNGFHGTVFEFNRNDAVAARNFFDIKKGPYKRNQFGYAVGGPILRNRLFWFTDYQGTRQVIGISSGNVQVPTQDMRNGIFPTPFGSSAVNGAYWAQILSTRLGQAVTAGEPYSQVFPGGIVPKRAYAAPAIGEMDFFPLPNSGANFWSSTAYPQTTNDDKAGQRLDINTSRTGTWFIYYHFDDSTFVNPYGAAKAPGFSTANNVRAQQAVLSNTKVFGPTAVNDWHIDFTRMASHTGFPNGNYTKDISSYGFITGPSTLGIVAGGGVPAAEKWPPRSSLTNVSVGIAGSATFQPNNTWQVSDNFAKIVGNHSFKFGGDFRYYQINERNIATPNGSFTFDGSETGNDFADYLIGAPASFGQQGLQILDSRSRYGGAFAQDSWRIKPNLTLNIGVRWEINMPWYDTQNKIETIIPGIQSVVYPTAPLGWLVPRDPCGPGCIIPPTLAPTRWNNLGPRIGLAWSPNASGGFLEKLLGGPGKTSIRLAYGLYHTSIEDLSLFWEVGDPPYGVDWVSEAPVLFDEPYRTRASGASQGQRFPWPFPHEYDAANKTLDYSIFEPINGSPGYDIHNRVPYGEHYNLTIQRQLGGNTVLSLAYIGTQGHRLIAEEEANPGDAALCLSLTGTGVKAGTAQCGPHGENGVYTRPDGSIVNGTRGPLGPRFASNSYTRNFASSNYNSAQVSVQRKMTNMTFLAAYTFSKAMDYSSGFLYYLNWTNFKLSHTLSMYDVPHNFVASYAYMLPFQRLSAKLPRRLTQGWSVNGITHFAVGFPVVMSQSGDRSLAGSSTVDFPNFVGPLVKTDPRLPGHAYFNKTAFQTEPLGHFGNANRCFFHGPGMNNFDLSVHKDTAIRERMSVQFRAEFFNVLNHTQFSPPTGNYNSSLFGAVTTAGNPRIGQLSLKFLW
jgi:hypothetical protein